MATLLFHTASHQLHLAANLAQTLSADQYTHTPAILSGSSVGQHVRHLYGFFECLQRAYQTDFVVDYDSRRRDCCIEKDPAQAATILTQMADFLENMAESDAIEMRIKITYNINQIIIDTTFERELYHNIEHSVHHLAIIKMAVISLWPEIVLPTEFGVANSTIRYLQSYEKAALVD